MTGKKRSHRSRSNSRSLSPDKLKHNKLIKSSVEQNEPPTKLKCKRSSSSDSSVSVKSIKIRETEKKGSKSRNTCSSSDSSVDSQNDSHSSQSSKDNSLCKVNKKKKSKKSNKKKWGKEKKLKKKHKKEKRRHKKDAEVSAATVISTEKTKDAKFEIEKSKISDESTDRLLLDRAKAMAPMTKEEWEKRQSVVRRVYDEQTGRHRLIKGDGEVIEEIVSQDRHREINRQATQADDVFFQSVQRAKLWK